MQLNKVVVFVSVVLFHYSLSHVLPDPPLESTKSEACPHGKHYIDSCKNMCFCDLASGSTTCPRMEDCYKSMDGLCPLGATCTDPMWGKHFQCFCNSNQNQTYECFDLRQHKTLDASLLE